MADALTQFQAPSGKTEESQLLECLFNNSECGVAILDDQLRYVRINDTLAKMNGFPADFHIGKTVREVLWSAATEIEKQVRGVFFTGKRVDNIHIVAKLSKWEAESHWNESYLPMKGDNGAIKQVCVIVTELRESDRYYRKHISITTNHNPPLRLTKRELQVLQLLASGKSNKEVAAALNISHRTVETYRKKVMEKLDAHSMVDLVRFAIRNRILSA